MNFELTAFWALAVLVLVPACLIIFEKSIVRSAFLLLGTLMGVAGLYILMGADFLGMTQIMVYIGGINVLLLFGIMLTHRDPVFLRKLVKRQTRWPAFIGAFFLVIVITGALLTTKWKSAPHAAKPTSARIGTALMSEYILPFEIISVLLLVTLVGAAYLARRAPAEGSK